MNRIKSDLQSTEAYSSPEIGIVSVQTEQGFAASDPKNSIDPFGYTLEENWD